MGGWYINYFKLVKTAHGWDEGDNRTSTSSSLRTVFTSSSITYHSCVDLLHVISSRMPLQTPSAEFKILKPAKSILHLLGSFVQVVDSPACSDKFLSIP